MFFKFLATFLLFAQTTYGQSEKHLSVPGTKCSLIPPEGFVAASNFSGFRQAETGASIMINEIPAPYQTLADGFTAESLKSRGMTLVRKEAIEHKKVPATLFRVAQAANGIMYTKQVLLFGDANGTVLVTGMYPEGAEDLESAIKEALLSTVYHKEQKEDPLEAAPFTVNVEGTPFQVVKYLSGSLLYSADGKMPSQKPTLIVGVSLAKVPVPDPKAYALARLKKMTGSLSLDITETNEVTIDNLKGVELLAEGKTKEGKRELTYQVMLFTEEGDYYILFGQTTEDFETYVKQFREIARSFKRKQKGWKLR